MAGFLLNRHWFLQRLLVGLCRWLRVGPLLDPAILQAISLFGCYLRQGHTTLAAEQEGSYAAHIFFCTSGGAVCAGSAQVTLVELRWSYKPGCNQQEETHQQNHQTNKQTNPQKQHTQNTGATCKVARKAMEA